jgi:hypothetical protein
MVTHRAAESRLRRMLENTYDQTLRDCSAAACVGTGPGWVVVRVEVSTVAF